MASSKTVRIDPLKSSDIQELQAAARNSSDFHSPWYTTPQTDESWIDFVHRRLGPNDLGFLVRKNPDAELVGFIDITNIVRGVFQSGYISYFVISGQEGNGIMTSGLKILVEHAFSELGLHRLEANIRPENSRSIALIKRSGFHREGYSPRYLKMDGIWRDHERWAILVDD